MEKITNKIKRTRKHSNTNSNNDLSSSPNFSDNPVAPWLPPTFEPPDTPPMNKSLAFNDNKSTPDLGLHKTTSQNNERNSFDNQQSFSDLNQHSKKKGWMSLLKSKASNASIQHHHKDDFNSKWFLFYIYIILI